MLGAADQESGGQAVQKTRAPILTLTIDRYYTYISLLLCVDGAIDWRSMLYLIQPSPCGAMVSVLDF